MNDEKKEIVKILNNMSGRYSPHNIFCDWVECMAIAIQNGCQLFHNELWQKREKKYKDIMNKYEKDERMLFAEMFGLLINAFGKELTDILGEIYMESECGNKRTGQFFTPFHISKLTAKIALKTELEKEKIELNEPSTGAGGMIIATAAVLKEKGINYQRKMQVTAQDLDWKGVYMTYVQLSLLGIKAIVVQGDTLKEPYHAGYEKERVFYTPAKMGLLI